MVQMGLLATIKSLWRTSTRSRMLNPSNLPDKFSLIFNRSRMRSFAILSMPQEATSSTG